MNSTEPPLALMRDLATSHASKGPHGSSNNDEVHEVSASADSCQLMADALRQSINFDTGRDEQII